MPALIAIWIIVPIVTLRWFIGLAERWPNIVVPALMLSFVIPAIAGEAAQGNGIQWGLLSWATIFVIGNTLVIFLLALRLLGIMWRGFGIFQGPTYNVYNTNVFVRNQDAAVGTDSPVWPATSSVASPGPRGPSSGLSRGS